MDSKFYEKDFYSTQIEEIEFIRSPYYDLARENYMTTEVAHEMLEDLGTKFAMMDDVT